MAARLIALACVVALVGCASSGGREEAARLQAFQGDLEAARAEWQSRVEQRFYRTSTEATQDLVSRYHDVYARWTQQPDALTEALLTYALALADRVDRGEVTAEQANTLLTAMKGDMDREKARLSSRPAQGQESALLRWWIEYWRANSARYAAAPGRPVSCSVAPATGTLGRVACS